MSFPRITIIIPTRERGDVLGATIRSVCAQDYDGLDILVSDNCSTDGTADIVRAAGDPRVRYVNTGKRLSMSHNWEFALSHVSVDDRYVMVIGDDDAIVPGALDRIAALIRGTGTRAVNSTFATFIWPSADNAGMGRLLVPMRQGYEVRASKAWLQRTIEGRCWYSDLPMLYAGGAHHIALIDAVRRKTGAFFHSCQPDIYSSVALSCATERYVFSHEPFAIAGHSRHSNGASWSASGKVSACGEALKANQLFSSEANIPWHGGIPTLPDGRIPLSADLLVYESYLQAMHLHDNVLGLKPEDMLPLFLARGSPDWDRMSAWIDLFVARHGLDKTRARREAAALKWRARWDRMLEYAAALRDTYRLEPSVGVQMRDVYEASVVAATILRTRPGMLKSYTGTLARRLRWSQLAAAGAST